MGKGSRKVFKMRVALQLFLCLSAAVAIAVAQLPAVTVDTEGWIPGVATHTAGPKGNDLSKTIPASLPNAACGYGEMKREQWPQYTLIGVAPNSVFSSRPMGGCGTCVDVRCNAAQTCWFKPRTLQMMIYDRCDACEPTHLNLNALAFLQLAPLDVGRIDILFKQVPCAFNGTIIVNGDQYRASGGGWLRLSLKNVAGAGSVTAVSVGQAGTGWVPMKNTFGAQWEVNNFGSPPLDLQVTNAFNQTLVMRNIITVPGQTGEITSDVQFTS